MQISKDIDVDLIEIKAKEDQLKGLRTSSTALIQKLKEDRVQKMKVGLQQVEAHVD